METMHCVVKTSDGDDLALAYLESNEMCVKNLGLEPSKSNGGPSWVASIAY